MYGQHRKKEGHAPPLPAHMAGSPPIRLHGALHGPQPALRLHHAAAHLGGAHGQASGARRQASPSIDIRRNAQGSAAAAAAAARILGNKGAVQSARQKDKFVPLLFIDGDEPPAALAPDSRLASLDLPSPLEQLPSPPSTHPAIFEDLPAPGSGDSRRGRITLYCTAEAYDRKRLEAMLKASFRP
jgi:hypothetical protein